MAIPPTTKTSVLSSGTPMVGIAFPSIPHPSNKRVMSFLLCPLNCLFLCPERGKHVVGMILYAIVVYAAAFRTPFRPRFDIYVSHRDLLRGSANDATGPLGPPSSTTSAQRSIDVRKMNISVVSSISSHRSECTSRPGKPSIFIVSAAGRERGKTDPLKIFH